MKSANQLGLSEKVRYAERDAELRQMRIIATALLLCMAALFVFGKYMETRYDGYWGFLRAFAEAGMIGGLADWFAVTALFRHPLGIPIPHTAIIPNNKERLGRTLASFLRTNFLTTKVVARRVQRCLVQSLVNAPHAPQGALVAPPTLHGPFAVAGALGALLKRCAQASSCLCCFAHHPAMRLRRGRSCRSEPCARRFTSALSRACSALGALADP